MGKIEKGIESSMVYLQIKELMEKVFQNQIYLIWGNFIWSIQICQTLSGKLSWSHYCEILSISDDKERAFHERIIIYALMKSK